MWAPEDASVFQLVRTALSGPAPLPQQQLNAALHASGDIPGYLGAILVSSDIADPIMVNAAFLIKSLVNNPAYNGDSWMYAREAVLAAVMRTDLPKEVRSALAGTMANLVIAGGEWPGFLDAVQAGTGATASPSAREGTMIILEYLAEDSPTLPGLLTECALGDRLSEIIEQREHSWLRAVRTIGHVGLNQSNRKLARRQALAILAIVADVHQELSARTDALNTVVHTCDNISAVLPPDQMSALTEMMLEASQAATAAHEGRQISMIAMEFWIGLQRKPGVLFDAVHPLIPRLVQILVDAMVYSEEECIRLEADANSTERIEDLAPHLVHQRTLIFAADEVSPSDYEAGPSDKKNGLAQPDVVSDESDADDEGELGSPEQWTLRKAAASALDNVAQVYSVEILPSLLPILHERLSSGEQKWLPREAAVLALGAVAPGCYQGIVPHLPSLMPYLVQLLRDPSPMVRSIASWTISRYSQWMIRQREGVSLNQNGQHFNGQQVFHEMLQNLLDNLIQDHKLVQAAAGSAIAALAEDAQDQIAEYLQPILASIALALPKYQPTNTLVLYDVVSTLARTTGHEFARKEIADVVIPLLLPRWNSTPEDSLAILPLCECLSAVFSGLGSEAQHLARPIYERASSLLERTIQKSPEALTDFDTDLIICLMELVIGMIEGLVFQMEPIISQSNMLHILYVSLKEPHLNANANIQQSALSLLGELAKCGSPLLVSAIPEFSPYLLKAIDDETPSMTCNNAIWALGEVAIYIAHIASTTVHGSEKDAILFPLIQQSLSRLTSIINKRQFHRSVLENAAITLGRLGLVLPEPLAANLEQFVKSMCMSLRNTRDDLEKEQAFRGLCSMIKINPTGLIEYFAYFCDAVGSWYHIRPELELQFTHILHGYKNSMGTGWTLYFETFPPALRSTMQQRYGL